VVSRLAAEGARGEADAQQIDVMAVNYIDHVLAERRELILSGSK
jgi:hypothetical protein